MKRSRFARLPVFVAVAALLLSLAPLRSQNAGFNNGAKSPKDLLTALKTANEALLVQQKASMTKLDALQQAADQLRIYASRH